MILPPQGLEVWLQWPSPFVHRLKEVMESTQEHRNTKLSNIMSHSSTRLWTWTGFFWKVKEFSIYCDLFLLWAWAPTKKWALNIDQKGEKIKHERNKRHKTNVCNIIQEEIVCLSPGLKRWQYLPSVKLSRLYFTTETFKYYALKIKAGNTWRLQLPI